MVKIEFPDDNNEIVIRIPLFHIKEHWNIVKRIMDIYFEVEQK